MESATVVAGTGASSAKEGDKGLKAGALGYISNLVDDGSESSKSALSQALDFAKALGDSIVVIFAAAPGGYGSGEVPEQRKAVEEFGQKVTQEAAETAKAAKVDWSVELINEHPHDGLITASDRHDARMIVVGSHGDHPVMGAIIVATPYKLVQTSNRPGLVVRA